MPRLTEELLRKRAEHNDGCLPDLEEIALHQQELEGIDNIEACCRHIRILLLQNNIIPKMENLNKLKTLEYLNLALNNISMIEGVEGCESLKKLDMTVNFVGLEELEQSVYNLKANVQLEDLYLTGNPCAEWKGLRPYVLAHLPQLKQFDGKMILPTERIKARQLLPAMTADLEKVVEAVRIKKAREAGIPVSEGAYTIESRNEMYMEMAAQKEEKEKNEKRRMGTEKKEPREIPGVYNYRGDIRQCNEGKWDFNIDDSTDPTKIVFELSVPKYLDTTQLDVDVNPLYVRVVVKDKLTQLKLPNEVRPDAAKVQRSRTTGMLVIDMPLVDPRERRQKQEAPQPELQPLQPAAPPSSKENKGPQQGYGAAGTMTLGSIYKDPKKASTARKSGSQGHSLLKEVKTTTLRAAAADDDDDDDIPPLEQVSSRR